MSIAVFSRQKTPAVDFETHVLPILTAHCMPCHGENKAGGLDLRTYDAVVKGGVSGRILADKSPDTSLLMRRISGLDGLPQMPLGFAPLKNSDVEAISQWIQQGASRGSKKSQPKHWAFVNPTRPKLPVVKSRAWVKNPIDAFVLARLEKEGIKPSPPADRNTLLRRVTLDLTGLPPTPGEISSFLADKSPTAYDKVVDRLLNSPHFGEKMALPWLDAARYADSNGFQQDGDNYQYVWRDWVVKALNDDMPFDEFAIEQLAGDLLPSPTTDQIVATAFNRNHMLNGEGGAIPEEQRNVVLFDRVDVTSTTFLGLTLACARCHDHKYDPLTQRDYYGLMAYFNNVPEAGVPGGSGQYRVDQPTVLAGSSSEMAALEEAQNNVKRANAALDRYLKSEKFKDAFSNWKAESLNSAILSDQASLKTSVWKEVGKVKANDFSTAFDSKISVTTNIDRPEFVDGSVHPLNEENTATFLERTIDADREVDVVFAVGSDDGVVLWLNNSKIHANKVTRGAVIDNDTVSVRLRSGHNVILMKIVNGGGIGGFVFNMYRGRVHPLVQSVLGKPEHQWSKDERNAVMRTFAQTSGTTLRALQVDAESNRSKVEKLRATLPQVMVMSDANPRQTHILSRGDYESPLEAVEPNTPSPLPPLSKSLTNNRLALAKWIVSPANPLTARVQVNRVWQMLFGKGLVRTPENFGKQGELPINQQLLDWLAVEFRESGWKVKNLVRMVVTSNTYRQRSRVSRRAYERDPDNSLLARGARFRMSSLVLRDVALAASGLLNSKVGGKPVYPYQPKGIWDGLSITKERDFTYPQSKGSDLYRRSIYTFWRRTAAPGNMFDASTRQACTVRPSITSTPMHALTTLNDVTWVEASRVLAAQCLSRNDDVQKQISEAFLRVCSRRPSVAELEILSGTFNKALKAFKASPHDAEILLSEGEHQLPAKVDRIRLAALSTVCLTIFNLDEALTRE